MGVGLMAELSLPDENFMSTSKKNINKYARDFGENIAARRHQLELSQSQLAEMVGMTQVSLSRIESGSATPKFQRLGMFAEALQCSVADLFTHITETEKNKGHLLAELLQILPPSWQNIVIQNTIQLTYTISKNLKTRESPYENLDKDRREEV